MAIWVAVGGRGSLVGAILGALVVNFAKTYLSETFPDSWLYFQGALFVGVVLLFPQGIIGLLAKLKGRRRKAPYTAGEKAPFPVARG
jgi:urea transport system permease protein